PADAGLAARRPARARGARPGEHPRSACVAGTARAGRARDVKVTPARIPEVLLIEPDVFSDERGFFIETWHRRRFAEHGIDTNFVQDNHSRSIRGTLRGLHYQL